MPTMKDKDLLKLLKKNGWQEVAVHGQDMPIGELNAILKWCGLPPVH